MIQSDCHMHTEFSTDSEAPVRTMIEAAIQTCEKFTDRQKSYRQEVYEDFQLIDWTLLESAMESADVW